MDARYAICKHQWLDECQVAPEIFEQLMPRLYSFMRPFVKVFQGRVAEEHAKTYVCGLLSNLERKNVLALEMLGKNGLWLPHSWIAGDDEMGRSVLVSQAAYGLG